MVLWVTSVFSYKRYADDDPIYTQKVEDVIGKEPRESDDPLRDGTKNIGEAIGDQSSDRILYIEIDDSESAFKRTTDYIKWLMNYFLALAWLVALIYLMYHGFIAVTAWGDQEKLKKWMSGVRYAVIAIIWIWVAWFFISIIFWLINLLAENT